MTHANDNRPAEFDAKLVAYMPALRKLAAKLLPTKPQHAREDLVQATLLKALEDWRKYRPGNSPYTWLQFLMRGINQDAISKAITAAKHRPELLHRSQGRTLPNQEHATDVSLVLSRVPANRLDDILAIGMGALYRETAAERGISVSRARERVLSARDALDKAAARADARRALAA